MSLVSEIIDYYIFMKEETIAVFPDHERQM